MDEFEAYKTYIALKNHFTKKDYNYLKYNKKIKINRNSFEKRNDKIFFLKLSKHEDLENYLISNFIINEKYFIKQLSYSNECENNYIEWKKRQQSLSYVFKNDLSKLDDDFDKNIVVEKNQHPILLKKYLGKEISFETLCIILDLCDAIKYWDKNIEDNTWIDLSNKVIKYTPFIKYDFEKVRKICVDRYG